MATTLAVGLAVAGPANAFDLPIDYTANTTTVLKKLNQKVTFPATGLTSVLSTEDFSTGTLTGELNLPTTTTDLKLGSLNLATVTLSIVDPSPVTGTVKFAEDFTTVALKAQQSFKVKINSIQPLGLDTGSANLNLLPAGAHCETSVTTADLAGTIDLSGTSLDTTLSGTYPIPAFTGCGNLVGPVLNSLVSGPGNTLTVALKTVAPETTKAQLRQAAAR
ncbi:hypothetical protein [Williamsia sp. 1135]|uniref:hypothetical protein n=1 Tax=Williamsia sp. 1135 TaxID=1889262 RepID=UPI000A0FB8CD|nr:hypothetical protein [Williamsia sp. 1135]ORM27763.1 hypothetical protein BFL43_21910 [Williamsia sp. 1135]